MLNGKTAIITGGSRGIGKACAVKLAQLGANIAILFAGNEEAANSTAEQISALGVKVQTYKCNVADFERTKEVFAQIKKDFGTYDILVNSAGITRDKLVLAMKEADFDDVIDVNLKGSFNTIKQVYPAMAKQRSGKIINIGSVSGLMGNSGQANYSASKAGVFGLTKAVAKELAPRGICCNAVAPGFIRTDMTQAFDNNEEVLKAIPQGRMGEAEEVAELVAFLASPSSSYITGEVIRIDGGMAM